jgi:ribonuclease-3
LTDAGKWSTKFLGYTFQSPELLKQALTHRSLSARNNERLEFLGDAVLDLAIAAALYRQEQSTDEGMLSRLRASLVRRETLADIANDIKLGDVIKLGSGEARSGGRQRGSILADGLEAVLGAIYLDSGYSAADAVISHLFSARLAALPEVGDLKDAKTRLQEFVQGQGVEVPEYHVVSEDGPPHDRKFVVQCLVNELNIKINGAGRSRRRAEQAAATAALVKIQQEDHAAS